MMNSVVQDLLPRISQMLVRNYFVGLGLTRIHFSSKCWQYCISEFFTV